MNTIVDGLPTAKYILFTLFYSISILALIIGIMGIVGSVKHKRCCLCLYSIGVIFLALLGIGAGVAGLIFFPDVFKNTSCSTNNSNDLAYFIPQFNTQYNQAYSLFATDNCPALYPNFANVYTSAQQTLLKADQFEHVTSQSQDPDAFPSALSTCTNINNAYAISLASIQSILDCTGMCLPTTGNDQARALHYVFSDVSEGIPSGSCYNAMVSATNNLSKVVGGIGIGVGAFFVLNIFFISLLCCLRNSEKDDEDGLRESLYQYEMPGK